MARRGAPLLHSVPPPVLPPVLRPVLLPLLLLLSAGVPEVVKPSSDLSFNLCRWCEASSPSCRDNICLSNCSLSSYCAVTEEICVAIWRKSNTTVTVQTLCHHPTKPLEGVAPALLLNVTSRECVMVEQPAASGDIMACGCRGEHECNDRLLFQPGAHGFSRLHSKDLIPVVVVSLVPPLLVAVIAVAAFYFYRVRCPDKPGPTPTRPDWSLQHLAEPYQNLNPRCSGGEDEESSGKRSPPGVGLMDEPTEPLPVKLEELVGAGRFAQVWKARFLDGQGDGFSVAVKVFPALEYASWRNEHSVLSELRHNNVVEFLAAEQRGGAYWLILAYHGLGNLQDFLTANTLSWEQLVAMATSIAGGLAHLHSDTTPSGTTKVPVAHRDLKSSNILLKNQTHCVLCDFGLALKLDLSLTVDDYANSGQVGTARYMAPEVLESRVNLEDLEAFKQMDVYSMALVLWEMASRCCAVGEVKSYEPAFGSRVCQQPCVDSMRDLVLRDRGRPDIPLAWRQHQGMNVFCSTITECWDHDPEARLTAPCVVERFSALEERNGEGEQDEQEREEGERQDGQE